jgi:nitrate/TMAO reductase-like tetraheme cytochrome c subunit
MDNKTLFERIFIRVRNPISITGLMVAIVCTGVGLPMMFVDIFFGSSNPYTGILTYLVFPMVSTVGVLVAVVGAIWASRKKAQDYHEKALTFPIVDFNDPRHRKVGMICLALGVVGFILVVITSYRAYHFSDSTKFCGTACHGVMKPEYTAYQHSPHARVGCVSCHIGPGAGWFVKSKITGAYQVYSVTFNKYSRPIETPIKNLRPAQDTCEQCHWPAKFFGAQQKTFTHFLSDETNSPWQIQTLLKIGGGDEKTGAASGIHWHMNIENQIFYRDEGGNRLSIPWVRSVSRSGKVTEYVTPKLCHHTTSIADSVF